MCGITGIININLLNVSKNPPATSITTPPSSPRFPEGGTLKIPISNTNPSVVQLRTNYTLTGTIYSIEDQKDKWKLILSGVDGTIFTDAPFTLDFSTPVTTATKSAKLLPSQLQKDSFVNVEYEYDNFKQTGTVTKVTILPKPKLVK